MSTNPNDAAVPHYHDAGDLGQKGLTKREEFAKTAMQGFCANPEFAEAHPEDIAEMAFAQADALIAALNKPVSVTTEVKP